MTSLALLAVLSSCGGRDRKDAPLPEPTASPEAELAQCLKDAGAALYGASWCEPCHYQLSLFGDAADKVPYLDCDPPPPDELLPECEALDLPGFPLWIFPDGRRVWNVMSLEMIAAHAGCPW
jgi:hypothetical protein